MDIARISLRAPLASWGAMVTDGRPAPFPIPVPSWVTGLLGAALGVSWHAAERLQALQDSLDYAVIHHRPPVPMVDYQTADLSLPWLDHRQRGTHDGSIFSRESSEARGTVIQHRPLWSDIDTTLLVHCAIQADVIDAALRRPAYPLYLGRGDCHPCAPLAGGVVTADSLEAAARAERPGTVWLRAAIGQPDSVTLSGLRDWRTRRFGGVCAWRRLSTEGGA